MGSRAEGCVLLWRPHLQCGFQFWAHTPKEWEPTQTGYEGPGGTVRALDAKCATIVVPVLPREARNKDTTAATLNL